MVELGRCCLPMKRFRRSLDPRCILRCTHPWQLRQRVGTRRDCLFLQVRGNVHNRPALHVNLANPILVAICGQLNDVLPRLKLQQRWSMPSPNRIDEDFSPVRIGSDRRSPLTFQGGSRNRRGGNRRNRMVRGVTTISAPGFPCLCCYNRIHQGCRTNSRLRCRTRRWRIRHRLRDDCIRFFSNAQIVRYR